MVRHHDLVNSCDISVSQLTTYILHMSFFPHSLLITRCVARAEQRILLTDMEQELFIISERLSSPTVFNGV